MAPDQVAGSRIALPNGAAYDGGISAAFATPNGAWTDGIASLLGGPILGHQLFRSDDVKH